MAETLTDVFHRLKRLLRRRGRTLMVQQDTEKAYLLASKTIVHRGMPLYFGGVTLGKNYVSYHLMAVYGDSAIRRDITPALKKRMQGKSCFNFRQIDEPLFKDLDALTAAAVRIYTDGTMARIVDQLAKPP